MAELTRRLFWPAAILTAIAAPKLAVAALDFKPVRETMRTTYVGAGHCEEQMLDNLAWIQIEVWTDAITEKFETLGEMALSPDIRNMKSPSVNMKFQMQRDRELKRRLEAEERVGSDIAPCIRRILAL